MNRDYYSDIRLCERFIFQSSLYLLNMFEKKVDSFISNRSRATRKREKNDLLHPSNIIDPDSFFEDPIKNLTKDLTKPVWNCTLRVDPNILLEKNRYLQPPKNPKLEALNRTFAHFFEKFKSQHEDQSSLRIHINYVNKESIVTPLTAKVSEIKQNDGVGPSVWQLFVIMRKCNNKQSRFLQKKHDNEQIESSYWPMEKNLQAFHQIIERFLERSDPESVDKPYIAQILSFVNIFVENINMMLESSIGPLVFCYYPKINFLPLLIHPMMMGLHSSVKMQLSAQGEKQEMKRRDQQPPSGEAEEGYMQEETKTIFQELKSVNCSKTTFINLDGYESEYNINMAKYLSKYIQYVSFTCEENPSESGELQQFFSYESERFLKKYYGLDLSEQERADTNRLFKGEQKQLNKRLFIFPIRSLRLCAKYGMPNIQQFASNFVLFIMREIIFNQIRQFGPSVIIISYSTKIWLQDSHWQEIMKQLTILGNMRLIFFPNFTKSYMFEQPLPADMLQSEDYYRLKKQYCQRFENEINLHRGLMKDELNQDMLMKISIFIKIGSGTFTLQKTIPEDSNLEKYKNYKIMKYVGVLLKLIARDHPVIEKIKMRSNQYLTIERLLTTYYTQSDHFKKLFQNYLGKYYNDLIGRVDGFVHAVEWQGLQYEDLLDQIELKYGNDKNNTWSNFIFRYRLEKATQKTQPLFYAHLQRATKREGRNGQQQLIGLQFQLIEGGRPMPVQLTRDSQVYYDPRRLHSNALFYIINQLPNKDSDRYQNYFGIVDERFDFQGQLKVQLRELSIKGRKLNRFQYLTEFNYFQTQKYIFLFWPQLYEQELAIFSDYLQKKYLPVITNDIYMALRSSPGDFQLVPVLNESYRSLLPRTGCTCYQVAGSSKIYIFGGFYTNQLNYLKFQVDISVIDYQSQRLLIENAPKSFHFDYTDIGQDRYAITKFHNDFVRPRIEYETFQCESEQMGETDIFLLGGVGEKFLRPYSAIGYMAHRLTFARDTGLLKRVKRIKMNGLVPVNLLKPTKARMAADADLVSSIQNRVIVKQKGKILGDSIAISHFQVVYDPLEQKFTFNTEYNFAQTVVKGQKNEIAIVHKETNQVPFPRPEMLFRCHHGKSFNENYVTLFTQGRQTVLSLHLQLPSQVTEKNPNFSKKVSIVCSSIIAIDINANHLYAILRHPQFTRGNCILAYFDLNQFSLRQNQHAPDIVLKQVYRFEVNVSHHVLKIANSATVAVLHGCRFVKGATVPEIVLKKPKKGPYKTYQVKPSQGSEQICESDLFQGVSASLFLKQKDGIIVCLSFKTIKRQQKNHHLLFLMEELSLIRQDLIWVKKVEKIIQIMIMTNDNRKGQFNIIQIKGGGNNFQLFGSYNEVVYGGQLLIEQSAQIVLSSREISIDQYYRNKFNEQSRQEQSLYLQKTSSIYEQYLCASEMVNQTQGQLIENET